VTEDVVVSGTKIPAGSVVQLCLAAANRDPARFDDPLTLRLDRASNPHLSFGSGIHRCVGAPLGRAQIVAALRTLFRVAPDFRAIQPLGTVRYASGAPAREIEQLVIGP
jgi:cytochrome P450